MIPLTVILADDHALVRAGLRALLSELAGLEVVGETGDGLEAVRLVRELKPDVALVDISMPGMNGLEAAACIAKEQPRTRVVILSMHGDDESVRRALMAGASGYILKHSDRAELEMALRAVSRGDTWLSPAVSKRLVAAFEGRRTPAEFGGPFDVLTPRQREVLQLIADGLSTKQIAARLGLSAKTVEVHRTELMERLGIHGVAGLVRYAIRVGLVDP